MVYKYQVKFKGLRMTLKMSKDDSAHEGKNGLTKPLDPLSLLESLSEFLGPEGQIAGMEQVEEMTSKMGEAPKLVSRCTYVNILKATKDEAVLAKFMDTGGWDVLNKWLVQGKDDENTAFLKDILQVYQQLPVTVAILKQNSCAKTIKQLIKSTDDPEVKELANGLVEKWKTLIKGGSSSSSSSSSGTSSSDKKEKDKKKSDHHKPKEGDHHKHKEGDHHKHGDHHRSKSRHSKHSPEHKSSPDHRPAELEDSDKPVESKDEAADTKAESSKPRAKTVKTLPTKFRATGN